MARLSTPDCEEFNAWSKILGWDTEYQQLGKGKLDAWFEPTLCSSLRIGHRFCSRSISVCGTPPEDSVPLVLPLTNESGQRGVFHGHKLAENDVAIICPGSEAFYRSPAQHHMITISFPRARLSRALEKLTGLDADSLIKQTRVLSLLHSVLRTLLQSTQVLIQAGSASTGAQLSRAHLEEVEEQLIAAFCAGLADATTESRNEPLALRNRLRYVKRARDYIEHHIENPLGMTTLAEAAGVTSRTLRYSFEDMLGVSPMRYIKIRRLQTARHQLLRAQGTDLSVTSVANRFCFSHLSYFARDYDVLFGESPSQTLRKVYQPKLVS